MSPEQLCRIPSRPTQNPWYVRPKTVGVYRIVYMPSGACYVGSSARCIGNRLGWHLSKLRAGTHSSSTFQQEWNNTEESDWTVEILEICASDSVRDREKHWDSLSDYPLSEQYDGHSERTKQRIRESRARYLDSDESRRILSENAKRQHAERRFGY